MILLIRDAVLILQKLHTMRLLMHMPDSLIRCYPLKKFHSRAHSPRRQTLNIPFSSPDDVAHMASQHSRKVAYQNIRSCLALP